MKITMKQFSDQVKNHIKDYLPEEYKDASVDIREIHKANGQDMTGILIHRESDSIIPTIYLDRYITPINEGSADLDSALSEVAQVFLDNQSTLDADSFTKKFMDFDKIKNDIVFSVVSSRLSEEYISDKPHREKEDLSLIYRVLVNDMSSEQGMGSIVVGNDHMKNWGVTEQDLYEAAIKNTKEKMVTRIVPMNSMLDELMPGMNAEEQFPDNQMYVITNDKKLYGAAALFADKAAMDNLCEKLGSGVTILPSSVHELLALPDKTMVPFDGKHNPAEDFAQMIVEVNETQVPDDEILSDIPYHYSPEDGFEKASDYFNREIEKTMEAEENKDDVSLD